VAAGLAREVLIQLAYVIGEAKPVSIYVDTFGTGKVDEGILEQFLIEQDFIQLTPEVLLRNLVYNILKDGAMLTRLPMATLASPFTLGNNLTWFLFLRTISPCMHAQVVSCP